VGCFIFLLTKKDLQ